MRMPKPHFPPPQVPDCFGLYPPTLLELEEDAGARIAALEKGVANAFAAAAIHLGEEEARRLFREVSRRTKRGADTHLAPDRDMRLLAEYEVAIQNQESIPALAARLHKADLSPRLGTSADAIAAQLRKLLRARRTRDRAALRAARLLRWSVRHFPPTLLGGDR